jgi:putative hemolysin
MKTSIYIMGMLLLACTSCKKDNAPDPEPDSCGLPVLQATASVDMANPCAIAVSKNGKIAITEYKDGYGQPGTTKVWNSYSDLLTKKAPAQSWQNIAAEAIAFDDSENIYVTETEQTAGIKIYKKQMVNGQSTYTYHKILQGDFNNPRGIAFDSQNRLYLGDDGKDRLLRFDDPINNDGYKVVAGVFGGLKGLALLNDVLYITSYDKSRIYKSTLTAAGGLNETIILENLNHPVDISAYGNVVAYSSPESSTITLLNREQIMQLTQNEASYSGCKKESQSTGALYGLAFVKTGSGYGLLSAEHGKNKIVFYEPQ